ncbi:family 43 glycosylhydrolase [Sphingomonas sp. AX6]|uniref:family 43 glycosylhydrolase n=1 Tax=Sphingomonas sp. AX6 TaxID=2653171 RepID=UPI0012F1F5FD|nr:family 43 glycosylhydrolase [Sphingomonas sp. AX6]VXC92388.1 Coagulation factor 5/8 type domain protein [Sphingomonas sp. AX6]
MPHPLFRPTVSLAALSLATLPAAAQERPVKTYANPIDIDYRYNFEQEDREISFRTGADPVIVRWKDEYYLFQTLADGYWRSTDLVDWQFIKPSNWPYDSVIAPAAWVDDDKLYLMPSMTSPEQIWVTEDPASGKLEWFDRTLPQLPGAVLPFEEEDIKPGDGRVPPGPWDPALFKDDDGKWYMYWNSSNVFPLYGLEIGMDGRFTYKGKPQTMFGLNPDKYGWERFGQDHNELSKTGAKITPFMEGAWMTKVNGKYYLQYGAPGTEFNAYANGTYVSDKPLGPFVYAPYNPVAYKPGGFVEGAGHGSTVQDKFGNWWNSGTPWIGHNWDFERRINLFPTKFFDDGQMMASSRFGDFPHVMPTEKIDDLDSLFTGWMLLSYRKPMTASSTLGEFAASRAADEDPRTFWVAENKEVGQTLTIDLGVAKTLRAVQVNFADYKAGRYADAPDIYTEFRLEHSVDGKTWAPLADTGPERRDRANAYLQLPAPVDARYVRYVHGHVGAAHLAISDLRVFGNAEGRAPAVPQGVGAVRGEDTRNATIRWRKVPGAVGYNIRWGIRPDRLGLTYQLWADELGDDAVLQKELRALTVGQGYHVAVEAFNETGVSRLSRTVAIK